MFSLRPTTITRMSFSMSLFRWCPRRSIILLFLLYIIIMAFQTQAFTSCLSPITIRSTDLPILVSSHSSTTHNSPIILKATPSSSSSGKKKRRRRKRKDSPVKEDGGQQLQQEGTQKSSIKTEVKNEIQDNIEDDDDDDDDEDEEIDIATIKDVANFSFDGPSVTSSTDITKSSSPISSSLPPPSSSSSDTVQEEDGAIPLPDIKDTLRRKELQAEMERMEEQEINKKKIDRKDRGALLKLLEQQPYADADDSFFEEEEYTTVSALLGEGAKPFLGIPTGPLQVGHFIGSLVIVLMAYVEYPGFPLTNLPSPLRGALQGGLGVIYSINTVLAVLAAFKAGERGQPAPLWIAKTFTVGGLAYDQLTQLPTIEEMEKAKARKGKRALKNKTKSKY